MGGQTRKGDEKRQRIYAGGGGQLGFNIDTTRGGVSVGESEVR